MKCGVKCPTAGLYLLLIGAVLVFAHAKSSAFCSCTIATQFLKLDERMSEHAGVGGNRPTYGNRLYMSSCPCALYRKDSSKEEPAIGEWSITRLGDWTFVLKPHKYGVARLYFIVEDPDSASNASAHVQLTVVQNPDAPLPFLSVDDRNILSGDNSAEISVEQNSDNGDYQLFSAVIGAFDYDLDDAMDFSVTSPPLRGTATVTMATNATLGRARSCPSLPPSTTTRISTSPASSSPSPVAYDDASSSFAPAIPCDFQVPYPPGELVWAAARVSYVPRPGFHGNDTFAVTIIDRNTAGTVVRFSVVVLHNPCRNGATCRGPADDPSCVHPRRQAAFHTLGYACTCMKGWVGSTCGTDFDDCLSSPCPPYRTCRDRLNAYDCLCPANLQHCDPLLNSWQTALVVIVTGIFICLITVGLILLSRRRNAQFLDAMWRF